MLLELLWQAKAPVKELKEVEGEHILRASIETNWVVGGPNGTAARLGIKRTTLQSRMHKVGIARKLA